MERDQSDEERIGKIKKIIQREIQKEISNKQDEVAEITEKIDKALRNLDILKYVVTVNYYENNQALTSKKGLNQEDDSKDEKTQTQLHPCVKKLLPFYSNYLKNVGDRSRTYETRKVTKACGESEAPSTVTGESSNCLEIPSKSSDSPVNSVSECDSVKSDSNLTNKLQPQYIPPLPNPDAVKRVVNSHRGGNTKVQHRLIIGNISKWIPPDTREDNSTHKWMVYIRSQEKDKELAQFIRKVRYFLHESYKPHDIIDVTCAPFHLTRRGWGEFPVRVQLHFHHPLNKPVDVIHNLKLDMTCSGVQTLGAETVVELWLHQGNAPTDSGQASAKKPIGAEDYANGRRTTEKCDVFDGSLLTSIHSDRVKSRTPSDGRGSDGSSLRKAETPPMECPDVAGENPNPLLAIDNSNLMLDRRKLLDLISREHDYVKNEESSGSDPSSLDPSTLKLAKGKSGDGNALTSYRNGTVPDSVKYLPKKGQNIGRIEMSHTRSESEIFRNLKSVVSKLESDTQSKYCMKIFRHGYLVNIVQRAQASQLKTVEALIRWFLRRWPIITKLAQDPTYKHIHPYSCPTEDEFFHYNIGKQRSAEWFRAKAIQKMLISLKPVVPIEEEIWTTKQILMWSRFHGYSPTSFARATADESCQSGSECHSKRLKSNEASGGCGSSSGGESDCDSSDASNAKKWKGSEGRLVNGLTERKRNFRKGRKKFGADDAALGAKSYRDANTYSDSSDANRYGAFEYRLLQCDNSPQINVLNVDEEAEKVVVDGSAESPSTSKRKQHLDVVTTPSDEMHMSKFICRATRQIGIKLSDEEIIPGVMCDSVVRVMSQITVSFLDELLRKSLAQAWMRNGERAPASLELDDLLATFVEHPQFDIFTNRGLGIQPEIKRER